MQELSSNTISPLQVISQPTGRQRVIDNLLTFHGENRRRAELELGCTSLVQHVSLVPAFCLHNVSVSGRAGPAVTSCSLSTASPPPPRPHFLGTFHVCVFVRREQLRTASASLFGKYPIIEERGSDLFLWSLCRLEEFRESCRNKARRGTLKTSA